MSFHLSFFAAENFPLDMCNAYVMFQCRCSHVNLWLDKHIVSSFYALQLYKYKV